MKRIAVEEHFWTEGFINYLKSRKEYPRLEMYQDDKGRQIMRLWHSPTLKAVFEPERYNKLLDTGEGRLKEMDEAGIDIQVLSINAPGVEVFDAPDGTAMAKTVNDELYEIVKKHPDRFVGFATFAPQDPQGAADELERAVKKLGFKGAKITSNIRGEYLDIEKYRVIFAMAEKLGIPIYLHPRRPAADMLKPYMTYPALSGSMWGFAAETSLAAMRLIYSGLFDAYPRLKIILGHLGEALPFWLWRIDNRWQRQEVGFDPLADKLKKSPGQYIKDNFVITTSGMFWQPALICSYIALGADNILFAVDYPHESNKEAVSFMDAAPICDSDKKKIYHVNAERILGLI